MRIERVDSPAVGSETGTIRAADRQPQAGALASHILIVEDSETQALQLRYLLEQEGWEVAHAPSGESALEELNQRLPRLIISDYHLPGIRGDELCRYVRMNQATRGIPILMLTVEEGYGSEPAGLDSGADDYVSKAVTSDVLLMRVRALLRSASGPELQDNRFHRARLLAVDDSPTYLASLSDALRREGYEVTLATRGQEGLDCLAAGAFDCMVIDLVMPDLDGIEVCRRAHSIAQDRSMAVIMLTSCDTKEEMARGLEAGADDFVGKSSDMTVLKARIRALLRRKFFQEENRRIREQLLRKEMEAAETRAAHEIAATRAAMVEELECKNRELESFSYSVSHDLRGPLRSIDGFSRALLEDYGAAIDATARDYLHRVRAAAQRMGELIDDLLQLSRVGRTDLQRQEVDLSVMAQTVSEGLRQLAPERRVEVLIPEGIAAAADRRLLLVVLENLLGNAWKFTARTAQPKIEFGATEANGSWTYFVRDNGAGFDMAHVARLFAPFQRLHAEANFPGTGIGLATVQRIIERHGGRVWAQAAVDQGATFFWTLPDTGQGRSG